ncbi:MAG: Flp pilus assembly protein CpaB [Bauldia sp.]
MKIARVAVLGVAVGAGILAAVLALNLTSRPTPAPQKGANAPSIETVDVLVAKKDIVTGTRLASDSVAWEPWPTKGVSGKFLTKSAAPDAAEKVAGAFARSTFFEGEPISEAKLIRTDQGFMSAILPEGKRAVATRIAADTSAGGFILPNDRVDVIMTRQTAAAGGSGGNQYITETILNNVRVLAIDQTIEEKDGEQVVIGQTATLELTPQQAQILTVAQQMSDRLTLALRSIADATDKPGTANADALHLIGGTKRGGSVTVVRNGVAKEVSGSK